MSTSVEASISSRRSFQHSTSIAFLVSGLITSAWSALIPLAKIRLAISDSAMGGLLLCLGIGSIVTMPLAGALVSRVGCRTPIVLSIVTLCIVLPLLADVHSVPVFVPALFMFGAALGCLNVAMNIHGLLVEHTQKQTLMPIFHGVYSVGGIAGAAAMAAIFSFGIGPTVASAMICAAVLTIITLRYTTFYNAPSAAEGRLFAIPKGTVLVIGLMICVAFLAEGAVLDWSGIYLTHSLEMPERLGGIGYATFSVLMTIGRLFGGEVIRALGKRRSVILGSVIAACGICICVGSSIWQISLIGFALVGLGCSNIVPLLYTATHKQHYMPSSLAVPAVTTMGYAGILIGPAAIGMISNMTSLPFGLFCVGALLAVVALLAKYVSF